MRRATATKNLLTVIHQSSLLETENVRDQSSIESRGGQSLSQETKYPAGRKSAECRRLMSVDQSTQSDATEKNTLHQERSTLRRTRRNVDESTLRRTIDMRELTPPTRAHQPTCPPSRLRHTDASLRQRVAPGTAGSTCQRVNIGQRSTRRITDVVTQSCLRSKARRTTETATTANTVEQSHGRLQWIGDITKMNSPHRILWHQALQPAGLALKTSGRTRITTPNFQRMDEGMNLVQSTPRRDEPNTLPCLHRTTQSLLRSTGKTALSIPMRGDIGRCLLAHSRTQNVYPCITFSTGSTVTTTRPCRDT